MRETLTNGTAVETKKGCTFGADAVLLGNFLPLSGKRMLDLGTGCGILPLLMRDRGYGGAVTALDIQPQACALLTESAARNRLSDITVLCADLKVYTTGRKFDLVCCNPPYFTTGAPAADPARAAARHETACTFADIAGAAARALKQGGKFCFCCPPARMAELFETLRACRLEPKRLQAVQHRADSNPFLLLIEARHDGKPGLVVLPTKILTES